MNKITCVFAFVLIGAVFSLPAGDSINQRDPVQIKLSNEEENPILAANQPLVPLLGQDLNNPSDLETMIVKDENLEPSETFGFGYLNYGGYGGYSGYGGRGYGGWGRRYGNSGYGGYGGYGGYSGNGWGRGYGGHGRRYYW